MRLHFTSRRNNSSSNPTAAILFGAVFALFGIVFAIFGFSALRSEAEHASWTATPGEIIHFEIRHDRNRSDPFSADVVFRYLGPDGLLESDQLHPPSSSATYKEVRDLYEVKASVLGWQSGQPAPPFPVETFCYVNPENPEDAYLVRKPHSWIGAALFPLFGLTFASIGIGIMWSGFAARRKGKAVTTATSDGQMPPKLLILFFLIFALVGAGTFAFLFLPMAKTSMAAKNWIELPAEVVWSTVRTHSGSDSTTYSADILYRYEFEGRDYLSNTRGLMRSSSSNRSAHARRVEEHPPGTSITCFVNPERPWQAVIDPTIGASALFALIPLAFLGVGLGGLVYTLRKRANGAATRTASTSSGGGAPQVPTSPGLPPITADAAATAQLCARGGRRIKAFGMLAFALFWNAIVSVFLFGPPSEDGSLFITLFMIPFVLVGVVTLFLAIASLGALRNPVPMLQSTPGQPRLGSPWRLEWDFPAGSDRLRDLRIELLGEETATYRSGKNDTTARQPFFHQILVQAEHPSEIRSGSTTVTLPAALPPSWKFGRHAIVWTLQIRGSIRLWPDLNDKISLDVLPSSPDTTPAQS